MLEPFMIRARPPLLPARAFLAAQGLPIEDLTDEHLEHFFFVGPDGAPIGLVGLEIYGAHALLRSLAVDEGERGRELGSRLVKRAEDHATAQGAGLIYLLTTTAEGYFARLGYARIDRSEAPPPIQATKEFATLCPASSVLMLKKRRGSDRK
jgi:amino-acid N-acetyltransferase